jgi:hypothetical protein
MTNAERIEENNAELREAIEMANNLPDATDCVSIGNVKIDDSGHLIITYTNGTSADVGKVVGKDGKDGKDGTNATTTAVATQQTNGLMSAKDKKKLDNVIRQIESGYRFTEISSGVVDGGNLYIGNTYDSVIFLDWDYNEVTMGALIDTVRALCDELGVSAPFSSGYSLRRNRSVEQTDEPTDEPTDDPSEK